MYTNGTVFAVLIFTACCEDVVRICIYIMWYCSILVLYYKSLKVSNHSIAMIYELVSHINKMFYDKNISCTWPVGTVMF